MLLHYHPAAITGKTNVNTSKYGPFLSSSSRTAPPRDILLKQPDPSLPGG